MTCVILPHAAKKTKVRRRNSPAQLAWLYRVRRSPLKCSCSPLYAQELKASLGKLSRAFGRPREEVRACAAHSGAMRDVRFATWKSLPAAKIDGVCFWLDDQSPVIGMSLRFDRIDNFWFVLRHELEHVIRLHGRDDGSNRMMFDAELEGERAGVGEGIPVEERVANGAAANFCVPMKSMDSFIARKTPFFAERDILGFAKTLNIHPGLVAGQLGHRTGKFERFRKHLVKMRAIVCPRSNGRWMGRCSARR